MISFHSITTLYNAWWSAITLFIANLILSHARSILFDHIVIHVYTLLFILFYILSQILQVYTNYLILWRFIRVISLIKDIEFFLGIHVINLNRIGRGCIIRKEWIILAWCFSKSLIYITLSNELIRSSSLIALISLA